MELYDQVSQELSQHVTKRYSTSFSAASRLFDSSIRVHIYAIYGLTRFADEIVDTYQGSDAADLLLAFATETYQALTTGYSTNPVIHSFQLTARQFGIDTTLVEPFFESMAMDLTKKQYTQAQYQRYIYGSAEVIGLMCLRVFCAGDTELYTHLTPAARHLGAAYQKVNFLRDMQSDFHDRGRVYFPKIDFATCSEADKAAIIADIAHDMEQAHAAFDQLPRGAQRAVRLSYAYYSALLARITKASMQTIRTERIRISNAHKLWIFIRTIGGRCD